MSEENVELVQSWLSRWNAGERSFADLIHPDAEILDPAIVWTASESAPDAGTRRGYGECRAYMKEWLDDFVLEPPEINEVGSTPKGDLVCSFAGVATGRASGARTEIRFAITFRFADDGRIVAIHEYATLPEACQAAGLSESEG